MNELQTTEQADLTNESLSFLKRVYEYTDRGYLNIFTLPDGKSKFFDATTQLEDAVAYALRRRNELDVYFGVGLRRTALKNGKRGDSGDVCMLPAVFADIDIADPRSHKSTRLPKTQQEAMDFLNNDMPLAPSYIISSGHGLHVYWFLDEPIYIETQEDQEKAQALLKGWNNFINLRAIPRGWIFDNVGDLARMLRVPGTINHKVSRKLTVKGITL